MIGHDRFLEFAALDIDFPLSATERATLDGHLQTCAACRAEAAALRSDAQAIVDLPRARLDPARADEILGHALHRPARRPTLRLLAVAALFALLALGALAVGAELLRQMRPPELLVVPPPPSTPPSAAPIDVTTWQVADIGTPGSLPEMFTAIVSSGSTYVTVGGRSCTSSSDGLTACWADVYRSTDGRTWTMADSSQSALSVGTDLALGGPTPGMVDVAGSERGFVAIGYAGDDVLRAALWWSADGLSWERPSDPSFAGADLRSVVNLRGRWVVAGTIVDGAAPRGAAWWSDDGVTWLRAPDSAVFDVGGYIDTGESPGAGGIRAMATDGALVVGVGTVCDAEAASCPVAIWTSDDGIRWDRQDAADLPNDGALVFGGFVVHGQGGFLVAGTFCPATGCVGVGLWSPDGRAWTEVSLEGLGEIRGIAAAGTGFVIAAPTGRTPPGLALFGSSDGRSWTELDDIPAVNGGVLSDIDMTAAPDGSLVVLARFEVHDGESVSIVLEVRSRAR
jgi:hypothetical protein